MTAPMSQATTRASVERVRPRLRLGPLLLVRRIRVVVACLVLCALAAGAACLSTTTGAFHIPLRDVLQTIAGHGTARQHFIVVETRLPRAITGLVAGLALGVSGALVQGVARNPLASPDILGVTTGAGLVAVAALTGAGGLVGGITNTLGIGVAAMVGGLLTGISVYALAWKKGVDGQRLVLVGVATTGILGALTEWLLLRVDLRNLAQTRTWLYGSLGEASWAQVQGSAVAVMLLVGCALALARSLQALQLDEDLAAGLGVRLGRVRAVLRVLAVLLVGVATAAAGPIGFVAFVAPQIAQRLTRLPAPPLIASGLCGAALLVLADWVARVVLPQALPVGIITSLIGGPYMVALLVRTSRKATA